MPQNFRPGPLLIGLIGIGFLFIHTSNAATSPLSPDQAILVLNRLGYGSRPGDLTQITKRSLEDHLREQLAPVSIDDSATTQLLSSLSGLERPPEEWVRLYQTAQAARKKRQEQDAARNDSETASPSRPSREEHELRRELDSALSQLQTAKLLRAVHSQRQLQEVLVDFWFNHFNVDARKQLVLPLLIDYESSAIRPHIWGNFRDLLGAVASHGAMLVYLDNWRSVAGPRTTASSDDDEPPRRGLNENFGRELLELHTLGVDGGYTQADVLAAARVFTGWTVDPDSGTFLFRERAHDRGEKIILGNPLTSPPGLAEGAELLDRLATHPSTARHLATKLLTRFVSDNPPPEYIDRVAAAFLRHNGNLTKTYEAVFLDPAFFETALASPKVRSPFEFVAASLRATDSSWTPTTIPSPPDSKMSMQENSDRMAPTSEKSKSGPNRRPDLPRRIAELGQPLYQCAPPTGYPEDSAHWNQAGGLLARINFSRSLMNGSLPDFQPAPLPGNSPAASASDFADDILGRAPSPQTLEVLREIPANAPKSSGPVALLLGSPDFQIK